ncbi:MAG: sigma-70 family RNA polymerase sigma factor, partial [Nannocystaceae bacterium]
VVEALVRHVEGVALSVPELATSLAMLVVDSRRLRDRATKANHEAFFASKQEVSAQLGEVDRDGILTGQILGDLARMACGESAIDLVVRNPPRGSRRFATYVQGCQDAERQLAQARARFVEANLRLVISLVQKVGRGQLPLHDLIQEGNLGLMKAVDRFDPARGVRFSTYAAWWIRHTVSRAIGDKSRAVRLPVHMVEQRRKLHRLTLAFEAKHGRSPTDWELAELAELKLEKLRQTRCFLVASGVSLDTPIGESGRDCFRDILPDPGEVAESRLIAEEQLAQLQASLAKLSPVEAEVLRLRMGEKNLSFREIGERFSLSRERIRQIQIKALGQLREHFRAQHLL